MALLGEAQTVWCGLLTLDGEKKGVSVVGGSTLELSDAKDGSVAAGNRIDMARLLEVVHPRGEGTLRLDLGDPSEQVMLKGDDANITKLVNALEKAWKHGEGCHREEWDAGLPVADKMPPASSAVGSSIDAAFAVSFNKPLARDGKPRQASHMTHLTRTTESDTPLPHNHSFASSAASQGPGGYHAYAAYGSSFSSPTPKDGGKRRTRQRERLHQRRPTADAAVGEASMTTAPVSRATSARSTGSRRRARQPPPLTLDGSHLIGASASKSSSALAASPPIECRIYEPTPLDCSLAMDRSRFTGTGLVQEVASLPTFPAANAADAPAAGQQPEKPAAAAAKKEDAPADDAPGLGSAAGGLGLTRQPSYARLIRTPVHGPMEPPAAPPAAGGETPPGSPVRKGESKGGRQKLPQGATSATRRRSAAAPNASVASLPPASIDEKAVREQALKTLHNELTNSAAKAGGEAKGTDPSATPPSDGRRRSKQRGDSLPPPADAGGVAALLSSGGGECPTATPLQAWADGVKVPSVPQYIPISDEAALRGFSKAVGRRAAAAAGAAGDPWAKPVRLMTFDSDFWVFFRLCAAALPGAAAPPHYHLTPGGRAEVNTVPHAGGAPPPAELFGRRGRSAAEAAAPPMTVNAAFFDAYVDGWRELNPWQVTVAPAGGPPVASFAAPQQLWGYLVRNIRPGVAGAPPLTVQVSGPGAPAHAGITTTVAHWNDVCARWEGDRGLTAAGRRDLLARYDRRPQVALLLPPKPRQEAPAQYWSAFVSEWEGPRGAHAVQTPAR